MINRDGQSKDSLGKVSTAVFHAGFLAAKHAIVFCAYITINYELVRRLLEVSCLQVFLHTPIYRNHSQKSV